LLFAEHECSILCGFNDEYCGAYVYKDATKILDFLPALSPIIFAKYCKKKRSEVKLWAPYRAYHCPELMGIYY
jgi:hypothetical protein